MMRLRTLCCLVGLAILCGCEQKRPETLQFWHNQTQDNATLLQKIVDDYNATNPPMKVELVYAGNYEQIYQKATASIGTPQVPDLVIAYKSMVAEYVEQDAAVALDDYIRDPQIGLTQENLDDIYTIVLDNNRYANYGNKFYSFPFVQSVLMLYYNADMLKAAGFDKPPETWIEFRKQCEAVRKLGKKGYAISADASTIDGIIMSFGGEPYDAEHRKALLDQPAALEAYRLIYDLCKSGGAYQIDRTAYGDLADFANQECAFAIRSSNSRAEVQKNYVGDKFHWDMAPLPHVESQPPVTVLFGGSVTVMKTTPERQRAAWAFVKYFASTDVTSTWGIGTGYVPIRKSAADTETVKAFFADKPQNRRAFDALPIARPEPPVRGWQAVRKEIELAENEAIGGRTPPEEIVRKLNEKANDILRKTGE